MQNVTHFRAIGFLTGILLTVFPAYCQTPALTFNGAGEITGSPPEVLHAGSKLEVGLSLNEGEGAVYYRDLVSRMTDAFLSLQNEKTLETYRLMGISPTLLPVVRRDIGCFLKGVSGVLPISLHPDIEVLVCPNPNVQYVRKANDFLQKLYQLEVSQLPRSGQAVRERVPLFLQTSPAKEKFGNAIAIRPETSRLNYALRLENPSVLMAKMQQDTLLKLAIMVPTEGELRQMGRLFDAWEKEYAANYKPKTFPPDLPSLKNIQKILDDLEAKGGTLSNQDYTNLATLIGGLSAPLRKHYTGVKAGFDPFVKFLSDKQNYALRWLWWTGGRLTLHPFELAEAFQVPILNGQISAGESKVESLRLQLVGPTARKAAFEKQVEKEGVVGPAFQKALDSLSTASGQLARLTVAVQKEEAGLKQKRDRLKSLVARRSELDAALKTKDFLVYEGTFFVSDADHLSFMRNHDARRGYLPMNLPIRQEYTENQQVNLMVYNARDSVKFDIAFKPATEATPLAEVINPVLAQLSGIDFSQFINAKTLPGADTSTQAAVDRFLTEKAYVDNADQLLDFFGREFHPIAPLPVAEKDTTPVFFTQVETTLLDTLPPRRVTYTISNPKQPKGASFKSQFTINKLYRFLPAAGVFYSGYDEPDVTAGAKGGLNTASLGGLRTVVGLKIYPFPTYLRDPYFVYSRKRLKEFGPAFDYRKFHLLLGADVAKPTRSFVTGVGLDLWSGISLQTGLHWVRAQQPLFDGGQPAGSRNLLKNALYTGISIDPAVVIQLINLFK
ncbi:hypothetical protein [Larkinella soli]|uniref:hypothetical protein n=1 Tax=Larkinella soli TaxID=1770527 RepID=UPI000FFB7976|nr:hypothetical protein [Larkinella soli]